MIGVCGDCGVSIRRLEYVTGVECHQITDFRDFNATSGRWSMIVYVAGGENFSSGVDVLSRLRDSHCTFLLVVPPRRSALRDIALLSRFPGHAQIAICGLDECVESSILRARRAPRVSSLLQHVVSHLTEHVPRELLLVSIGAAVLGLRKVTATALPRCLERPERSLRRTLASASLPTPSNYPALFTGVYLAYDTEVLDRSIAEVAVERGFSSTDDIRRYLITRTGLLPTRWKKLGFEEALHVATNSKSTR